MIGRGDALHVHVEPMRGSTAHYRQLRMAWDITPSIAPRRWFTKRTRTSSRVAAATDYLAKANQVLMQQSPNESAPSAELREVAATPCFLGTRNHQTPMRNGHSISRAAPLELRMHDEERPAE